LSLFAANDQVADEKKEARREACPPSAVQKLKKINHYLGGY
jgi:hypothetical protein